MELVEWLAPSVLETIPAPARTSAQVSVLRGHSGAKLPYSIPFTYRIMAEGRVAWWAWINFDQLFVEDSYNGPQLLARYCEGLRRLAEGKTQYDESVIDDATWHAVFAACYRGDDPYLRDPPADMRSLRSGFARKTLAELAVAKPGEFHAYEIQTVASANSRRSDMRSEFRIISRPEASHRWMFWTHAPKRISHDSTELHYWFTRHAAQLRGSRRPAWNPTQRDLWFEHVHRELTGKSSSESKLDALAAAPDEKPDLGLILGSEDAAGGVRRWVIPRAVFAEAKWGGANLELAFTDQDDGKPKKVTLLFRSIAAARATIGEFLSGERRRLGIGSQLRGIIAAPADDEFLVLVGLSESEEQQHMSTFIARHGTDSHSFRSGLLCQIIAPYRPKR